MSKPPVDPLAHLLRGLRRAAEIGYPWSVSPHEARALVAEVERLRALEADAERARVKADLWSYYEAFVAANGAGSITELVVQRDAARAEAATMRAWAEEAAKAENANARDLEAARDTIRRLTDLVRHQRGPLYDIGLITEEEYAVLAGDHSAVARLEGYDALRADLTRLLVEAKKEGARSAVGERDAERAAVLACLRVADDFSLYDEIATVIATIERGAHRREGET